jgi:hypothetical protein
MDTQEDKIEISEQHDQDDDQSIEQALQQMTTLYKSRCVQAPLGTNVTIREIDKKD